jgi:hypothetical protein
MALELRRLTGEILHAALPFPYELSALVLKGLATRVRVKATDTTDIWRCLEIAFAARVMPQDFSRSGRDEAAAAIRALFKHRDGAGMTALAEELRGARRGCGTRAAAGQPTGGTDVGVLRYERTFPQSSPHEPLIIAGCAGRR